MREGGRCQGGKGEFSVLNSFTTKDTKVHEGKPRGLILVELFNEFLAEAKIITTGGTGEHRETQGKADGCRRSARFGTTPESL